MTADGDPKTDEDTLSQDDGLVKPTLHPGLDQLLAATILAILVLAATSPVCLDALIHHSAAPQYTLPRAVLQFKMLPDTLGQRLDGTAPGVMLLE